MVVDRKFIALLFSTLGLAMGFGSIVTMSLFATRPENVADAAKGSFVTSLPQILRSPSSLHTHSTRLGIEMKPQILMERLSVPCLGDAQTLETLTTVAKQIQLHTASCDAFAELRVLSITNKTNGYSATIFQQDPHTISTDYISLDQGQNLLTLAQQTAAGKTRSFELTILRK